jgi:hypothetical protein
MAVPSPRLLGHSLPANSLQQQGHNSLESIPTKLKVAALIGLHLGGVEILFYASQWPRGLRHELQHCDRGLESHWRHGCLCCPVCR